MCQDDSTSSASRPSPHSARALDHLSEPQRTPSHRPNVCRSRHHLKHRGRLRLRRQPLVKEPLKAVEKQDAVLEQPSPLSQGPPTAQARGRVPAANAIPQDHTPEIESGTRHVLVVLVGRLVAFRESKAILFERQTGVVESRDTPMAEIARPPSLPRKIGSGISIWGGEHQRQSDGREDESACHCDGLEFAKTVVGRAVCKHDFPPNRR